MGWQGRRDAAIDWQEVHIAQLFVCVCVCEREGGDARKLFLCRVAPKGPRSATIQGSGGWPAQ